MNGTRTYFRKPYSWLGVTAIDASADSIAVGGKDIRFKAVSGNIWVNAKTTAVANATAYLMAVGEILEFAGCTTLSIISDGSGGTYEYILWE
jgi:hypothetical protein